MVATAAPSPKAIITEAAQRHGIDPALEWGVFGTETSFGKDVTRSAAGALGPLQLEPETARSLGVKNPNNLREAAEGAAKYLAQFKSRGVGGMLSAYNAGPAGGYQDEYVKKTLANAKTYGSAPAGQALASIPKATASSTGVIRPATTAPVLDQAALAKANQKVETNKFLLKEIGGGADNPLKTVLDTAAPNPAEFMKAGAAPAGTIPSSSAPTGATGATGGTGTNGYVNPLPGFTKGRTDMGVDLSAQPGTPIHALGDAKILEIQSNWYKGQPYVSYELLDGPMGRVNGKPGTGKVIYVAEQIAPSVKPGDEVKAGQQIGTYASSGTGVETGIGTHSGQTLAQSTTGYTEGQRTQAGQQMEKLLSELAAHHSTTHPAASTATGHGAVIGHYEHPAGPRKIVHYASGPKAGSVVHVASKLPTGHQFAAGDLLGAPVKGGL